MYVIMIIPCLSSIVRFNSLYSSDLTQIVMFKDGYPPSDYVPGYVSVPAGNSYISRHCRRLTEESGRTVYAIDVRNATLISRLFLERLTFSAAS